MSKGAQLRAIPNSVDQDAFETMAERPGVMASGSSMLCRNAAEIDEELLGASSIDREIDLLAYATHS